jgi:hypothetical protein
VSPLPPARARVGHPTRCQRAQATQRCRFCQREASNPVLLCQSTRDMEDRAIGGEARCYLALAAAGGGERGMARIDQLIRSHQLRAGTTPPALDEMAAEAQELDLP